ncbi:phenoloxidase-activating factor 1-like [Drosophila rhopaloa]|uniref:Peptidase S1 domain-containing protein n=1 Tax=Drosophila rhopaloa TaxID=1041015 RepID=A0ABM5J7G0_DRORH|nr:phenoloxidase-activating factor 1-like [Drosophila rhopaloa]
MQSKKYKITLWIFSLLILQVCSFSSLKWTLIGAELALTEEFPAAAHLCFRRSSLGKIKCFCGGTLISRRAVLTAAHCFYSDVGVVNVVQFGETFFDGVKGSPDPLNFEVLETKKHPNFRYPVLYNDIGIVKLRRSVIYTPYIYPACLPYNNGDAYNSFTAVGWGQTDVGRLDQSRKLRKVELHNFKNRCRNTIDPNDELPEGYRNKSQLCVGSTKHKDTCNGDSGGPLLISYYGKNCRYQVMGIISLGLSCDTPNIPSIFTRVHFYRHWIKKEMGKV